MSGAALGALLVLALATVGNSWRAYCWHNRPVARIRRGLAALGYPVGMMSDEEILARCTHMVEVLGAVAHQLGVSAAGAADALREFTAVYRGYEEGTT